MVRRLPTLENLESLKQELNVMRRQLLEADGWTSTCEVGSIWLWKKVYKGREIFVPTEIALALVEMGV